MAETETAREQIAMADFVLLNKTDLVTPQRGGESAPGGASGAVDEAKVCRSPIVGVVVRVLAQPGQALTPLQVYTMFFARDFQNSNVAFLGLNLDPADHSSEVMATLMKNPWPWP